MKLALSLSLSLALAGPAAAADGNDVAAALRLQGEARVKALAEGARREGEVMVYHSSQTEDLKPVFDAFTAKYGVKVRDWRSSSENVVQRIISETRAGKRDVDFVENNAPEMEALHREKMLMRIDSPTLESLRPGTVPQHHEWATSTMDVFVQAYNTGLVKREELPKTYQDLADPRWKGRLGIEAEDQAWFGTLLLALGQEQGTKLFSDIVAKNGISVRKGHTLLANLVATGEIPLALTVYNYKPPQLKAKGGAIDWFVMQPVIAQLHAVAVTAKGSHPFAAALLFEFFLNEGQPLLASRNFVPSNSKVPSPFGNTPIRFIDPAQAIENQDQWTRAYEDTIVKRSGR
ncbi:MAG: ABC transporter substrate-binding protein [Usitatibacter sp.]